MKKILGLCVLALNSFAYTQYELHPSFDQYFQNCSLLMNKYYYINCYDYDYKGTKAIAYRLTAEILNRQHIKKRPKFTEDTNIPKKYRTYWEDYIKSGYTRGHVVPNQSMNTTPQAQFSTFLMSNITPQKKDINNEIWNEIEKRERYLAKKNKELEVLNLIFYEKNPQRIKNNIAIPSFYVKILKAKTYIECYKVPNDDNFARFNRNYFKEDCSKYIK
ncbi:DNA/RNA non-specific endonuclease [Campylobacter insulaenigrae]|uniref:DNA/RNA non-specific endonuclease n=1 Tax=Campylobacter insulaenigrae TaxID=260714 RepID=A0ABY3G3P8_9BACT|nr:DNA/RNA non-specific endonuclease [Campylobacter insulaenigrae]MCR6576452.1 DNA/RNA non-specific endonuclease [Campylobacter insulaenigrae]MCR6579478.1 DNA/RNA non-specific endonuclease [Campylobacter insulaenigrae]MCR6587221.1 DNA/RNA non-specific endonuclease [Campylobacter insulaenigrae]TWO24527.1 DNA/RNA non-specific endonuclease [Campylobacter insulaenigrae]